MNTLFQDALLNKNFSRPPIWFMRQAGRYHSHYQKLKEKYTFTELCKNPELAAEVTLGPIQDFNFDVAIIFSDLLFPLEALGMGLSYENTGPELSFKLNQDNITKLQSADAAEKLNFQKKALQCCRQLLPKDKSLIGFVGGPWTLFLYATEGSHSGNALIAKNNTELFDQFWEILKPVLIDNIKSQLAGGAEIVMIFDTAAGEVSPLYFQSFVAPKLMELSKHFPKKVAYYSKGTQPSYFDADFKSSGWAGYGFDHRNRISDLLKDRSFAGFIQGNFDQSLLFSDTETLKKHFNIYINQIKNLPAEYRSRWICGLGHGVLPKTPEKNVKLFVEWIQREFT